MESGRGSPAFCSIATPAEGLQSKKISHSEVSATHFSTLTVNRFCTYHNMYDDALILLPMICLFRIASCSEKETTNDMIAGGLLALTVIVMILPARMIHFRSPWQYVFTLGHTIVWLLVLPFLVQCIRKVKAVPSASV